MTDRNRPEHLEEVLATVKLHTEVEALHVVRDDLPLVSDDLLHEDPGHVRLYQVSWPDQTIIPIKNIKFYFHLRSAILQSR